MDCAIERCSRSRRLNAAESQQTAMPRAEASSFLKAPAMLSEKNFSPRLAKSTSARVPPKRKTLSPGASSLFRKGNKDSAEVTMPQKPLVDAERANTSTTGAPFSVLD